MASVISVPGSGTETLALPRRKSAGRLELRTVICTLVTLSIAFIVVYPIILLIYQSLQVGLFGTDTAWGLDNWKAAFSEPRLRSGIINTLTLTITRQAIAFVIGVVLAWVLARTDIPGRHWLEFGFWIAFFMPSLTGTLGWILLLDPSYGLINTTLMKLPFITTAPFNIFSWGGIVFAHLAGNTLAIKVMLLTPAFRNMDAAMEDASRASGAGTISTLFRVVVPIMAPTILVVFLMGTIKSMEAFEIELILGAPAQIEVFSTLVYDQVFDVTPRYGTATALSMVVLVFLLPLIVLQQWFSRRRSHATISGRYTGRLQHLGRWRWPLFALVALLLLFITAVPTGFVFLSTFTKLFGYFSLPEGAFTLANWKQALHDPNLTRGIINTLSLAIGASLTAMAVFTLVAYISVRTRFALRGVLDFLTWLPSTIPGIVIGLGFLWLFLGTPLFRPLYGTIWILIIAVALGGMTLSVQIIKTNLMQIGDELEEASGASGANLFYTMWRIVFPLIAPAVLIVGLLMFASATREISLIALLSTGAVKPLAMMQLNFMEDGNYELATVVGVLIIALTLSAATLARVITMRLGASGRAVRSV